MSFFGNNNCGYDENYGGGHSGKGGVSCGCDICTLLIILMLCGCGGHGKGCGCDPCSLLWIILILNCCGCGGGNGHNGYNGYNQDCQ